MAKTTIRTMKVAKNSAKFKSPYQQIRITIIQIGSAGGKCISARLAIKQVD